MLIYSYIVWLCPHKFGTSFPPLLCIMATLVYTVATFSDNCAQ